MRFFRRNASILIITNGYWRSRFFQKLFSAYAHIVRIDVSKNPMPKKASSFDIIMWENGLDHKIPSSFDPQKIALFDYMDEGSRKTLGNYAKKLNLNKPKKLLLLSNHNDTGCLPAPPPKLTRQNTPKPLKERKHNLFFCCSATFLYLDTSIRAPYTTPYANRIVYNQRLEWAEKFANAGFLENGQGIINSKVEYLSQKRITNLFNYSGPPIFVDPIPKEEFAKHLIDSRILPCSAGHSRWTYRHVEGFYNRCLVLSCDFLDYKMLLQFPRKARIQVKDGIFNASIIHEMLENIEQYQKVADEGYDFARTHYRPKGMFIKSGYRRKTTEKLYTDFMSYFE